MIYLYIESLGGLAGNIVDILTFFSYFIKSCIYSCQDSSLQ